MALQLHFKINFCLKLWCFITFLIVTRLLRLQNEGDECNQNRKGTYEYILYNTIGYNDITAIVANEFIEITRFSDIIFARIKV